MLSSLALLSLLNLATPGVLAHVGIWHPSVYGFNASGRAEANWYDSPVNTDFIRNPLRLDMDLTFDEWWFHGVVGAKPNAQMELPAGGRVMIEHSCNKAFTSYTTRPDQLELVGNFPCPINTDSAGVPHYGDPDVEASNGPLHTADIGDAQGCALSISYKSDATKVFQEDLVVFSTNKTCVWARETYFEIPKDMPACPEEGCVCAWNWMHGNTDGEGYGNEMYMVGFDCKITNAKSTNAVSKPAVPVFCADDEETCVTGAKQGIYWEGAQADGWNIPVNASTRQNPVYNTDWGFANGAQNDIFEASSSSSSSSSSATTSSKAASSSSASSADSAKALAASSNDSEAKLAVVDSGASSTASSITTGVARQGLSSKRDGGVDSTLIETVLSTRTHVVSVTEDARSKQRRALNDAAVMDKPAKRGARHDKRRLASSHKPAHVGRWI